MCVNIKWHKGPFTSCAMDIYAVLISIAYDVKKRFLLFYMCRLSMSLACCYKTFFKLIFGVFQLMFLFTSHINPAVWPVCRIEEKITSGYEEVTKPFYFTSSIWGEARSSSIHPKICMRGKAGDVIKCVKFQSKIFVVTILHGVEICMDF